MTLPPNKKSVITISQSQQRFIEITSGIVLKTVLTGFLRIVPELAWNLKDKPMTDR